MINWVDFSEKVVHGISLLFVYSGAAAVMDFELVFELVITFLYNNSTAKLQTLTEED